MPPNENDPAGEGGAVDEQPGSGRNVVPIVRRRRRDWRAVWEPMRAQAHTAAQQRRGRVLAHADLADALTTAPIGYARPDQWNGYVPPETDAIPMGGGYVRNTSPRRAALVEICAEALRREQEANA